MKEHYTVWAGHRIHYVSYRPESGRKEKPVVLLHGFMEAVFVWDALAAYLAENGYFVLCPDLAGHGQTDSFAEVHGMDLQASLVKQMLDKEGVGKAAVIGHSMGGYVAAAFGCLYPESVCGIGFFHSSPAADTDQAKENRWRMIALLEAGKTSFVGEFMPDLFAPGTEHAYQPQIRALVESARSMDVRAIVAAQKGMAARPGRLQVYELPVPFLFIIGKADRRADVPRLMAQTLLPQSAHVLLIPSGHMGFYERESECRSFINSYLSAVCW